MWGDPNFGKRCPKTSEIAKINGAKGGKKSGESKRRKKALKETLKMLLELKPNQETCDKYAAIFGVEPKTFREVISGALLGKAFAGDVKAFETIRDTIGETIVKQTSITDTEENITVKKIYVTEKELLETDQHIDEVIDNIIE